MNKLNCNLSEQAIAEAAYFIWKNNGCPMNTSTQDWYAAINQLNSLYNSKKTSLSSKGLLSSLTSKKTSACKTASASKKSPAKKSTKKSK